MRDLEPRSRRGSDGEEEVESVVVGGVILTQASLAKLTRELVGGRIEGDRGGLGAQAPLHPEQEDEASIDFFIREKGLLKLGFAQRGIGRLGQVHTGNKLIKRRKGRRRGG